MKNVNKIVTPYIFNPNLPQAYVYLWYLCAIDCQNDFFKSPLSLDLESTRAIVIGFPFFFWIDLCLFLINVLFELFSPIPLPTPILIFLILYLPFLGDNCLAWQELMINIDISNNRYLCPLEVYPHMINGQTNSMV